MTECGLWNKSKAGGRSGRVPSADLYCMHRINVAGEMQIKVPVKGLLIEISAQLPNSPQFTKGTVSNLSHDNPYSWTIWAYYQRLSTRLAVCFQCRDLSMALSVIIKLLSPHIIPGGAVGSCLGLCDLSWVLPCSWSRC